MFMYNFYLGISMVGYVDKYKVLQMWSKWQMAWNCCENGNISFVMLAIIVFYRFRPSAGKVTGKFVKDFHV